MTTKYFALLTNQGAAKLANAAALGSKVNITSLGVGDGGGTLPTPDAAQTKLIGEKRRAQLNSLTVDAANSSQIIAEQIIPESEGGFWIREIGLYDADGVLIAVANCPETYKPQLAEGSGRTQTVRMILIVNSTTAVTLKIDPSVVLATRKYVDDAVIEVKAYADSVMKKHIDADNPHGQYLQIANALAEIKDAGLIADVLKNLGLTEKFSGRLLKLNRITENASYDKPAARLLKITVTAGGGGGGGAAAAGNSQGAVGSGGGAGGTSVSWFAVADLEFPVKLTVGKGGLGGVGAAEPQPGQSSSFGKYLSAGNGARGASGTVFNYGEFRLLSNGGGGTGIGGNFMNIRGGAGGPAITLSNGYESGGGGASCHSAGGNPIAAGVAFSGEDGLFGSGGSGAFSVSNSAAQTGGKGGDGIILIEEYA
jgi:hypothetical protein